tara:strand:- start:6779 stop:7108 length:330 start_codon:yes stop_codon:yes gene_type:complete
MSILQVASNFSVTAPDSIQAVYTAPTTTSVAIVSFTAANNSSVNASYKAYIVSNGGAVQPQVPFKVVVWGDNDLGIGIVGQTIPKGGQLRVESSAIDSIYFTVTGRTDD